MEKYIIRWQEKVFGRYEWRYLHNFESYSNLEIYYTTAYGQEGAVQLPEAVAAWICELLDTQDDLSPEMVRVED